MINNDFSYEKIMIQLNKCAEAKLKKELSNYNSKDYFAEYLKEIYFSIPHLNLEKYLYQKRLKNEL
ncbi:hypothetical protein HUQ34_000169 [Campylobacter jejuni]|nr:hypothetical protein [Campylobacter jejuni]